MHTRKAGIVAAISILTFFVPSLLAQQSMNVEHAEALSSVERAALDVVANRTAAYNAHDIDEFIAAYHMNVRVYEYPDRFLGEGAERMRDIFGPQFADNEGSVVVNFRHALENVVLSDETVTIFGHTEHNIGVYTIEDGLIVEVRLIEPF